MSQWLVTFHALPQYRETHPDEDLKLTVRVQAAMEGRATAMGWDQLSKLRRGATTANHFHYSTVRG